MCLRRNERCTDGTMNNGTTVLTILVSKDNVHYAWDTRRVVALLSAPLYCAAIYNKPFTATAFY